MEKQTFNLKSLLILSCMVILFFGFFTPEAMATSPVSLQKGQLPIPGSSETAGFLHTSLHGVLLENQKVQLVWEEDGNLNLRFYDREILWSSNTGGTGAVLYFMAGDGKFLIKDNNNNVIWSAGTIGGYKIWLQSNRNLVLASSSDQTIWQSGTEMPSLATDGWGRIDATGRPEDFMVPWNSGYNYLTICTEGADGGKRHVTSAGGVSANGGSGATIVATYEIGTGANQIPPGSFIRVIIGKKGPTRSVGTTAGCYGGGGTAVLLKRYNEAEWRLLQVAGGGGGAYSACCSDAKEGQSAETGRDGGSGSGGTGGAGGTNGSDGEFVGTTGWGVAGEEGCGAFCTSEYHGMWPGGDSDPTLLPGNRDDDYNADDFNGTFGFGRGGDSDNAGGAGGGYSGGGSAKNYHVGGGGGSYVNVEQMAIQDMIAIKNPTTFNTQDGFILYQFSNTLFNGRIRFAYNTGKCIDDYGSHTDNGTNIQTYNCHSYDNQQWYFHPTDRTIHSALDYSKCLDLSQSHTDNGTNIQLWDCNGTDAQHWVYNGLYRTMHSSVDSGKCWDAANGSASTANVNLQLWDCIYSNNNQKWVIADATTVSNVSNMKHIVPVSATSFAVHSHTGAESGSNIQLWTKDNTNTAEQWYFDGLAIKMRDHQNLCIDLNQSNTNNGNNIQLYTCNGTDAQKWIYDGMTKAIRSVINPDKCMQIEKNTDGVYGKRSNIDIQDCNGSAAQQFLIQE